MFTNSTFQIYIIWEKYKWEMPMILVVIIFASISFYYLYSEQHNIDRFMGVTQGHLVIEKKNLDNTDISFTYTVNNIEFKKKIRLKDGVQIDYTKTYRVEYSQKDPRLSRVIIDSKTFD